MSLEEAILENIDQAAKTAEAPARTAIEKAVSIQRLLVGVAIFCLIFGASITYALIKVDDVSDQNRQYLEDSCTEGNTSRANEKAFWLYIIAVSSKSPENNTPTKKAQTAAFLVKLDETYPQLDCSKVKDGERVEVPPKGTP